MLVPASWQALQLVWLRIPVGEGSTAQYGTAQHRTAQHGSAQTNTASQNAAQHHTAPHSTAQHRTGHHSIGHHSMEQASGAAYPQSPGLLEKMIPVPVACWLTAPLLQEIP